MGRALKSLLALMPRGRVWTRSVLSRFYALLDAIAAEYDRVYDRAADLLREALPSEATDAELLTDWERVTGADECVDGASEAARRAAVVARLNGEAPTETLLRATLDLAGYTPHELVHFAPFVAGGSVAGDPLSNDEWQHTVEIRLESQTAANDESLRCIIDRLLHVHVFPLFTWVTWLRDSDGTVLETSDGRYLEAP